MKLPVVITSTRRKRTTLQERALLTIEGMILATESENEMLKACYRFAHVGTGECLHDDWRNELEKTYRSLKKNGIL